MRYIEIKGKVVKRLGITIVQRILREFDLGDERLEGANRERDFGEHALVLCLFKDLKNLSYGELYDECHRWHSIAQSTLQDNVKRIRRALRVWANSILVPEPVLVLEKSARRRHRPSPCTDVCLWVDSSDFMERGKWVISRFDARFSHKTMSAAQRWLTILDGKGRVQFVAGPYSPKHYDGDLLIHHAEHLDSIFPSATMIGDNHFRKAAEFFKSIALITPTSEAGRPAKDPVTGKKWKRELPEEEQLNNEIIREVRSTVESPYGWLSNKFESLKESFRESEDQHDCLIRFALACHRLNIK